MKFSIITPSFNQAAFIERTLTSIATQQGDFEIEMIIEDGGSSDGTVAILKRFEEAVAANSIEGANSKLSFRWVSEKDRGQSHAINKGFAKAEGDIFAYLNSDDVYLPNALQQVAGYLKNNPELLWCYGRQVVIDENDKEINRGVTRYRELWGSKYSYAKLMIVNYVPQPAAFWRKEAFVKAGPFKEDEHLVMDYEFWCRLGALSDAGVLPVRVAAFRWHGQSKSCSDNWQQSLESYEVACRFTRNPLYKGAHRLHNHLIYWGYKLL